jgi:lipopolysaccharide transport system permease protein
MAQSNDIHYITSEPDTFKSYFQNIWKYRNLIFVFAKRDLKVKYAQTFLGLSWTLLQPLTALFIFTFFFGFLLHWESEGIAYPVYVLSGLLGWNYFSYIVSSGVFGLQESAHLIKKIYFPKSIIPFSKVIIALIELGVSLMLLIPLMIYYGQMISWKIIFIPFALVYNTFCGLLFVFWVSVFAYKKRDLLHLVPFILYFGIWLSPVFFNNDILPQNYRFVLDLNPMANVVQMWRWSLFGFGDFKWVWILNFGIITLLLFYGMFLYNRRESAFTDSI